MTNDRLLVVDRSERWKYWRLDSRPMRGGQETGAGMQYRTERQVVDKGSTAFQQAESSADGGPWREEYERDLLDVNGYALVILHASNPWASSFSERRLTSVPAVVFSGADEALQRAWVRQFLEDPVHRFVPLERLADALIQFLVAWRSSGFSENEIPWDLLAGRSSIVADSLAPLDLLFQGALTLFGYESSPPQPWWWTDVAGPEGSELADPKAIERSLGDYLRDPAAWYDVAVEDLVKLFPGGRANDGLEAELNQLSAAVACREVLFGNDQRGEGGALVRLAKAVVRYHAGTCSEDDRRAANDLLRDRVLLRRADAEYRELVRQLDA